MVNRGYQTHDKCFIDYDLWRIPLTQLDARGPADFNQDHYFCSAGAAQTFGRFCHETYTSLLSKFTRISGLNLGFSGAGPSFFIQRPGLIEIINSSSFCIVQVMSGRSVSNSYFEIGTNQGIVRQRGTDDDFVFAETAYAKYLRENSATDAIELRREIQQLYINEYMQLASVINVPTILLYFSVRKPGVLSGTRDIGQYWGAFPHFVDQHVIEQIRPLFTAYVEVVTQRGLPQTIVDQSTGEKMLLWDSQTFPNIKYRYHNLYYPSPQMQLDAALSLLDIAQSLATQPALPKDRGLIKDESTKKLAQSKTAKRPTLTLPAQEANFVCDSYATANCLLEYGSGGTTVFASERGGKIIYSIESDKEWAFSLRQYIENSAETLSMPEIIYVDVGPTQDWGFPQDSGNNKNFYRYPLDIWFRPNLQPPEVILIDGRFRVACFLSSAIMISQPTRVLFDDYVDRPKYHVIERFVKPSKIVGRMAVFDLLPGQIDRRGIRCLIQFSFDPS